MIDFDFLFLQPQSVKEAHQLYQTYSEKGKNVMYFGGGTEFISRARAEEISVDVVIDMKHIPECLVYQVEKGVLTIGAGVTLSTLTEQALFPLLSAVTRKIATKTARNKITIGGNLCSDLPYKEAYLPFLLAESSVVIATEKGLVKRPIEELTELKDGEFLVQILTDEAFVDLPFSHEKRTVQSRTGYPIVTMAMMEVNHHFHAAMSGLCEKPIRTREIEDILNSHENGLEYLPEEGLKGIPERVTDDELASKEYRTFVCKTLLQQLLAERKGTL